MSIQKLSLIVSKEEFLHHLKSRMHMYHCSNMFFRDFHYGILSYAEVKGRKISYGAAEELATIVISDLEKSGILKPIKPGSWMLNYPEFRTVSLKPSPAAKPAASAAPPKPLPQAAPVASPPPSSAADAPSAV
ncbi:MAG: hypothetical protein NTU47_17525 [Ignavibacteriales bacterium]|nr:hypothetical protein [Ignavibacteriales bacterium]